MFRKLFFILFFGVFILLVQSFQCASPEITTAKVALKNRDYQKAETFLEKELQNNPSNAEAYLLLAETKIQLGDLPGAARVISLSDPHIKDAVTKVQAEMIKGNIWRICYNTGIDYFNQYFSKKRISLLDSAILIFQAGVTVRPQINDFYPLIGQAYEVKGDTQNAIKYYELYGEKIQNELRIAYEKGLYLKIPRANALSNLGKPNYSKGLRFSPQSDSIIIDNFSFNGIELYLFSNDREGSFNVFGWKVNPPKDWLSDEKEQPTELNSTPFAALAQIFFNRKQYNQAIENVKKILILEPENSDVNAFLFSIYDVQGKRDEALKFIETLVQKDPNNKLYRAQYGDILMQLNQYDKAIEQYEFALKIDPNYDVAIRNCAAAYKNKVAMIIKQQSEMLDSIKKQQALAAQGKKGGKDSPKTIDRSVADIPTVIDTTKFMPYVEKSIDYYQRAKNLPRFSNDYMIYEDLAQLYYVSNKTDDLKKITAELEAIEFLIKEDEKEQYYYALLKIYDTLLKNDKKVQELQDKINNLKK
ncbi:MAG: tetratricopeptide repeat protein [Candidatus Kapaibacteriales bacterium]